MSEPIGSLCVMRDEASDEWLVSICQGNGYRYALRRFRDRDAAAEFAIEERARRTQTTAGVSLAIHFPEECPCRGDGMKW